MSDRIEEILDAMGIRGCKVERSVIERMKIIGPMDESKRVMKMLHDGGWNITRSGPYTDSRMHPNVDMARFLYTAERELTPDLATKGAP